MQRFILVMKSRRMCFKELRMMLKLVFKAFIYVDRHVVIYCQMCQTTFNLVQLVSILFLIFISILFLNTCKLFPYQFYLFFERGLASSNCQLILMSLHLVAQINLKKALYFSVNVFNTEELIGDAIFTSSTRDGTFIFYVIIRAS